MRDLSTPTQPLIDALSSLNLGDARKGLPRSPDALLARNKPALAVSWARHQDEVTGAQHLRYKVFTEEMGARLSLAHTELGVNMLDAIYDHLIVCDQKTFRVVGTYRVLRSDAAKQIGCPYSESEFDLVRLAHLRPKMVELGRSCVYRDYRSGSVIMALWAGLGGYMQRYGFESMLGCVSVLMDNGGHFAVSLYRSFVEDGSLAPIEYHAFPHVALPVDELNRDLEVEPPALVKGYLRLDARICGAPTQNPDFNVADFLALLRLSDINPRYIRRFLHGQYHSEQRRTK